MGTRKNYQRKANGNESPLHVLPVASKLIDYTLDLTDNTKHFPKKVRFTIVNRIQDHVLSIYEKLLAAWYKAEQAPAEEAEKAEAPVAEPPTQTEG